MSLEMETEMLNETNLLSENTPYKVEQETQTLSFEISPSCQQSQQKNKDSNVKINQEESQLVPNTQEFIDQTFSIVNQSCHQESIQGKIDENIKKFQHLLDNQSIYEEDIISQNHTNSKDIKDIFYQDRNESLDQSIQPTNQQHMRTRSEASLILAAFNINQRVKDQQKQNEKINFQEESKICQCEKLQEIFQKDINNEIGNTDVKCDENQRIVTQYFELRTKYLKKFNEFEDIIEKQANQIKETKYLLSQKQQIIDDLCDQLGIKPDDDIVNNFMNYFDLILDEKNNLQLQQQQLQKDLFKIKQQQDDKEKENKELTLNLQEQKTQFDVFKQEQEIKLVNLQEQCNNLNSQLQAILNQSQSINEKAQSLLKEENHQLIQNLKRISLTFLDLQKNSLYVLSKFFKQLTTVFSKNLNIQELIRVPNDCFIDNQNELKQMIDENCKDENKILETFEKTKNNASDILRIVCSEYRNMIEEMNRSNEEYFKSL